METLKNLLPLGILIAVLLSLQFVVPGGFRGS